MKIRLGLLCLSKITIRFWEIHVKCNMESVSSSAPCLFLQYLYSHQLLYTSRKHNRAVCLFMHCMWLFFFYKICYSLFFLKQMLKCSIQSFTHYCISNCDMYVFYVRVLELLYPLRNMPACNNSIKVLKISTYPFTN